MTAFRRRSIANALVRLRAAMLDLTAAGCHSEAAELGALIRALEAQVPAARSPS